MLSYLAHGDLESEVTGLDQIPEKDQPPVVIVHYAFQIMVGIGVLLMALAFLFLISLPKNKWIRRRWLLKLFAMGIPLGFIAIEAGWTVTEVGRQPWIIHGIMRTEDALTPMPGIAWSLYLFSAVYISLTVMVILLLSRQIKMVPVLYDRTEPQS
jgi:cytochrome d ubiquinol oxidase subunit I